MPKYRVTSPDGKSWDVTAPDGASQEEVLSYAKQQWSAQQNDEPKQASVRAGEAIKETTDSFPRQLGLTARYGLQGMAGMAQVFTEPIRYFTDRVTGTTGKTKPLRSAVSDILDSFGVPKPETPDERVIGDATELMAGGGGLMAAARRAPGAISRLAERPLEQLLSAGGAGLAGGAAREGGGNEWVQGGAALAGSIAAPVAANLGMNTGRHALNIGRRVADWAAPGVQTTRNVDQQIELVLRRQGIDWGAVPERVRQSLRTEAAQALQAGGDLDPAAVRRALDFARVPGTRATRGMLTLDPVQITREQNLAKTGANTADTGLHGLANNQNRNNAALIENLNTIGARNAPDAHATGQRVINTLDGRLGAAQRRIDSLYEAARDSAGRSLPLNAGAFNQRVNQLLDEANVGSFLPADIRNRINAIALGTGGYELNVSSAEQLKTSIGRLQRNSTDRNARYALGLVRQALDETPLAGAISNPGNLPAVAGTVPPNLGQQSIDAFNAARSANRQFMTAIENNPALRAVHEGVEPDQFVQRFILGKGATVADVQGLRTAIDGDDAAIAAVRSNIAQYLKQQSLNGAADEVGKFSQSAFNKALFNIGERKLGLFFSREEIEQLRSIGRVSSYMQVQPVGSAVNNSNSGALVLGRGIDLLDRIAGKLPLGLNDTITGVLKGAQQAQAMSTPKALLAPRQRVPLGNQALIPMLYGSGLFAAQPSNQ